MEIAQKNRTDLEKPHGKIALIKKTARKNRTD
jgi:hypothetical protein